MAAIILLVLFVMVMFLWLLVLLGTGGDVKTQVYPPWLAWFAVLFLGLVVFLTGTGFVVWTRP